MPLPMLLPAALGASNSSSSLNDANLNPGTGKILDALLGPDGDVAFQAGDLLGVRGAQAIAQEVRIRCRTWLGEALMDVTAGVDFDNDVFTKPPDIPRAQAAFRRQLLATTGVASVQEVVATFDGAERSISIFYSALLVDGAILTDTVEV